MRLDLYLTSYLKKICLTTDTFEDLKILKEKFFDKKKIFITFRATDRDHYRLKKKKYKNLEYMSTLVTFKKNSLKNKNLPKNEKISFRLSKKKDWIKIKKILPKIGTSRIYYDQKIDLKIRQNYLKNWIQNFFKNKRADKMSVCYDKKSKKIHGFILLRFEKSHVVYDQLFVNKESRGLGVGSGLINWTNKKFCSGLPVIAGVHLKNSNAIKLYSKLGFKKIKRYHYYHYHS